MKPFVPRMRVFAGPNGSGKSTLKELLTPQMLGVYINPDEIEKELATTGMWDFEQYGLNLSGEDLTDLRESRFLAEKGHGEALLKLRTTGERIDFSEIAIDSYIASVIAGMTRQKLIAAQRSFTFETVMSHPSKIDLIKTARAAGFRAYLYYVATDDPQINIERVKSRVQKGGHPVAHDKIVSRYHRSLDHLLDAIRQTNRAYLFDNSSANSEHRQTWIAEITEGTDLETKTDETPGWFKRSVLDKITG